MTSNYQFDIFKQNNLIMKSKSSNDLISETFSAGSVDVCQVIRSDCPPTLPMRMEMLCDGYETVRTKRNTLVRCIDKIEKAKRILAEQSIHSAFAYNSYNKELLEQEKARRIRNNAFKEMDKPKEIEMGLCSQKSSTDLLNETFSAGSVDVCQVIRSDQPPTLPLRMEVLSDGFETVRTKRTTSKTCIKKCHEERIEMIKEGKQSGVSYSSYVETHDMIVASRKAKLESSIRSGLGTIVEDAELAPKSELIELDDESSEEEVIDAGMSSTDGTATTLQSSVDWWLEMQWKNRAGNNKVQSLPSPNNVLSQQSSAILNSSKPSSNIPSVNDDRASILIFDKRVALKNKEVTSNQKTTSRKDRYSISNKAQRYESATNIRDKYDAIKVYNKLATTQKSSLFEHGIPDDLTMTSSNENLSFDEDEALHRKYDSYSKSEFDSTIITTSDHMTTTNQVVITFSSESNYDKALSEDSPEPINSMYSPEDDLISIDSDDESRNDKTDKYAITDNDDQHEEDKYAIIKTKISDADEIYYTDNEEDVNASFILIGEHNFKSKQYQNYSQPVQYHYVDEKYMFSNIQDYQDENDNTLLESKSPNTDTGTGSFHVGFWRMPGNNNEVKSDHKKKTKKKKKKKKATTPLGVDEIVIAVAAR